MVPLQSNTTVTKTASISEVSNFSVSNTASVFKKLFIYSSGCTIEFTVVLICIFLMTNDVKYLLMSVLSIYVSLGKSIFKPFAQFKYTDCLFIVALYYFCILNAILLKDIQPFLFF